MYFDAKFVYYQLTTLSGEKVADKGAIKGSPPFEGRLPRDAESFPTRSQPLSSRGGEGGRNGAIKAPSVPRRFSFQTDFLPKRILFYPRKKKRDHFPLSNS